MKRKDTIAVVVGSGTYNDLGLVRSLGEAGLRVILLAPSTMIVPIWRSRYVERWMDIRPDDEQSIYRSIERLLRENVNCRFCFYPAGDSAAIIVSHLSEMLDAKHLVPHAARHIEDLMDKHTMCGLAAKNGMNVPNSDELSIDEAYNYIPSFPCIVKPLRSIDGSKSDIAICRTQEEWKQVLEIFNSHATAHIQVQKLIEGNNQHEVGVPGVSINDGNSIIVGGTIEKHRLFGNGSTVFATFVPYLPEDIRQSIGQLMRDIGYNGIFDLEFLCNDEGWHFIECNLRNGAYGYAVTRAGLNLPSFYAGVNSNSECLKRIVFMEERTDLLHVKMHQMTLKSWIADFLRSDVLLWWNWRDPMPTMTYYWHKIFKR